MRLHRQETELAYLNRIEWENVDRIIFITDRVMERFLTMFPSMKERAVVIHNAVDCASLALEKLPGAGFNLGLLGYCPKLKAPHVAFDILTHLKQTDRRYSLFIKGKSPEQLDWLWKRPDERRYYQELRAHIAKSAYANSIVFEPHNENVATWLTKIGFILSTSDLERSHQAVAEGMASAAIPVIRDWHGAHRLYPAKYIFSTASEAVGLIQKWNSRDHYEEEMVSCQQWARQFDAARIVAGYQELIETSLATPADAPNCA